jgi:hypothetical protein
VSRRASLRHFRDAEELDSSISGGGDMWGGSIEGVREWYKMVVKSKLS